MKPGDYSRYLAVAFAACVSILAGAAFLNAIVDPYGTTRLVSVAGFNERKPQQIPHARTAKLVTIYGHPYDIVLLGTSQVEQGFNPGDQRLGGRRIYNLGLSEMRLFEVPQLLEYASRTTGATTFVVALDFIRYNPPPTAHPFLPVEWGWSWLANRWFRTLVSAQAVADSWNTLRRNRTSERFWSHDRLGWLDITAGPGPGGDLASRFDSVDRASFNEYLKNYLDRSESIAAEGFDHTYLQGTLQRAAERNARIIFFIPPSHARQLEILRMMGLLPLLRQWRGELARLIGKHGNAELWDFSGYNDVTVRDDWYSDTVHFRSEAGMAVLDRVLDLRLPEYRTMSFGRRVVPETGDDWGPDAKYHVAAARYAEKVKSLNDGTLEAVAIPAAR